jgi:hypothetical protein
MLNNNVNGIHLGGGVVLFEDAVFFEQKYATEFAEKIVSREQDQMYKPAINPETGKKAYLNRSGYYFDYEDVNRMPRRGSMAHQDKDPEVMKFLGFLEESRDTYLLKYLEMFPIAFKNIWWKVKGHIVSYGPGVYLGVHSDTSVDYCYGIDEPSDQLATRSSVSCLIYFNDSVESGDKLDGTNFTGGHHYFNYLDIRIVPKRGSILMFPANYMAAHEVLPVEDGIRYSYLGWYSHGSPNSAVNENVVDPIKSPDVAQFATNVYMPSLRDDFKNHVLSKGGTSITVPGFSL